MNEQLNQNSGKKAVSWRLPLTTVQEIFSEYKRKKKENPEKYILQRGQTLDNIKEYAKAEEAIVVDEKTSLLTR